MSETPNLVSTTKVSKRLVLGGSPALSKAEMDVLNKFLFEPVP